VAVAGLLPSWPRLNVQFAFNTGGTQGGTPFWNDYTGRLQGSWTCTLSGRQYELDAVQSGTATFTLDNTDGTFDVTNTASPLYGSIKPFRLARVTATWPPSQNQLPQGLAKGTATADAQVTAGSRTTGFVTAPPSGQTSAITWTYPVAAAGQACGLGATNPGFTTSDSDAIPVIGQPGQVPGQPWTFTVYASMASGGQASLQLNARICWYNQAGTRISTSDGPATAVPTAPSWTRLAVTGTAPAGAVWARIAAYGPGATTTASTVYLTGWQFEQAAAATAWADPGVTYPVWSGYAERFRSKWNGTARGTVEIPCVDALAGLARLTLVQSFQQQLQSLGPSAMYPFNEPSGSSQFADATGHRAARVALTSPSGPGGATITSGNSIQGSGSVGAPGPVVTLTNPNAGQSGNSNAGMYIGVPAGAPVGPPPSGGWTRLVCFRTTVKPASIMMLWTAFGSGATGLAGPKSYAEIYIDSNGHLGAGVSNADGSQISYATTVPDIYCPDGNWHIAVIQLSSDGTTFNVSCDNYSYQSTASGDMHPTGCAVDTIGASAYSYACGYLFSGDIAWATEIPAAIGSTTAADLGFGFASGWAGESSAQRAQRILTMAGYPGTLTALGTQEAMGGANLGGQPAAGALQTVADSEAGQAYVDPTGTVTLAGRRWRYLQPTPTITFGENTPAGEVPYLGDVEIDLDPDHIYNTIDVQNQVAAGAAQQPDTYATNAASTAEYFPSSLQRTINVQNTGEPRYAAAYLASQYAEPLPRAGKVTVDPSANPGVWPAVLGVQFGTRSRLMRRPNAASPIQLDTFIEQIEWRGDDQGRLQLSVQMSPAAPYQGWLLAAPLHTTLATAATAGASTVTLGALNGSASNPASTVLPGGTQLVIGYGTPLAETVTVAPGGVAATSPGYTSVAVALTAALANGHAAGVTVCQPPPAGLPAATLAAWPTALDTSATLTATGGPRAAY
jgi:hypothetical protein